MKYFIIHRNDVKPYHYENNEPSIHTARGSCCGDYIVLLYQEGNEPWDLQNGLNQEQFEDFARLTSAWVVDDA